MAHAKIIRNKCGPVIENVVNTPRLFNDNDIEIKPFVIFTILYEKIWIFLFDSLNIDQTESGMMFFGSKTLLHHVRNIGSCSHSVIDDER